MRKLLKTKIEAPLSADFESRKGQIDELTVYARVVMQCVAAWLPDKTRLLDVDWLETMSTTYIFNPFLTGMCLLLLYLNKMTDLETGLESEEQADVLVSGANAVNDFSSSLERAGIEGSSAELLVDLATQNCTRTSSGAELLATCEINYQRSRQKRFRVEEQFDKACTDASCTRLQVQHEADSKFTRCSQLVAQSYRRKALHVHPDKKKNPSRQDVERFSAMSKAAEILGSADSLERY